MTMTAFDLAQRYVGIKELAGRKHHPLIQWWLSLCAGFDGESADETAWCSAFVNGIAWELRLPRSKSAGARSWLLVGTPIGLADAEPGYDIVVLNRANGNPDASVIKSPGHVGFYAGREPERERVLLLAGNQGNAVSVAPFPASQVLGVRRLRDL